MRVACGGIRPTMRRFHQRSMPNVATLTTNRRCCRAAEEALDELERGSSGTDHGDRVDHGRCRRGEPKCAGGFGGGFEVLAYLARLRLDVADARDRAVGARAVMPEMKTSRPFAGTSMACEKWPDGCRILSLRICRCS